MFLYSKSKPSQTFVNLSPLNSKVVLQILPPRKNCLGITVILNKNSENISSAFGHKKGKELDLTVALLKLEVLTTGIGIMLSDLAVSQES